MVHAAKAHSASEPNSIKAEGRVKAEIQPSKSVN
jgi:hypothetical protein